MYYYVEDKQFLRRAQRDSSSMLTELVEELRRNGMNRPVLPCRKWRT